MKNLLLLLTFIQIGFGQSKTQTIRGIVKDKITQTPLIGASISIKGSSPQIGTSSDQNGSFILKNVPLGRKSLTISYVGYENFVSDEFIVVSTKETFLEASLIPATTTTDEVTISASRNAFEPLNTLSVVSTRSFTVEETERIPAGINDPGRVALSYPGVQRGLDDTENQIVVRGNSPIGVLWRLEGIDIPNPNHFAVVGSSGGGVTVFSAQLLGKSDFSTGGFAAEYGNSIAGAYDMHFRSGNFAAREHRARVGIMGIDFATEGPIKKDKSSYLINYRYSTLGLLSKMGFYLVGERVINDFQDLSFNITSRGKKSITTVFGFGGLSLENYLPVSTAASRKPGVSNHWEDRYKPSNVAAVGVTNTRQLKKDGYFKTVVAWMGSQQDRLYDTLSLQDVRFRYNTEQYTDSRLAASATYVSKLSTKTLLKTGLIGNYIYYDFLKQTSPRKNSQDINQREVKIAVNGSGNTQTMQQYAQLVYQASPRLSINGGYHFTYLALNNKTAIEPRLSLQYSISDRQKLSFATGKYSKIMPLMIYSYVDSAGNKPNQNLDFIRSNHYVLAYHFFVGKIRVMAEAYRQDLYAVPVSTKNNSSYWMLNYSADYPEFALTSKGKGKNQGVDLAIEKQFSDGYYFLATGSAFDASYSTLDGRSYNSRFNTRFSTSYTVGKEFYFKRGGILQIGSRFLLNGGLRYTPADIPTSKEKGSYVAQTGSDFSEQVPAYQRLDSRIAYRFNKKKLSGNIGLDIQNVLNNQNPTGIGYNNTTNSTYLVFNGSGLIPVLTTQFDF